MQKTSDLTFELVASLCLTPEEEHQMIQSINDTEWQALIGRTAQSIRFDDNDLLEEALLADVFATKMKYVSAVEAYSLYKRGSVIRKPKRKTAQKVACTICCTFGHTSKDHSVTMEGPPTCDMCEIFGEEASDMLHLCTKK